MKPSIPKGTRDFSPTEVANRTYIMNTIKTAFETFGFQPIETPSFENSSTLMGKYGEEGDRLIFKILESGEFWDKIPSKFYQNAKEKVKQSISGKEGNISNEITPFISKKALRYDLTVPFARYVVQHQNEITFPFKRYQVQPVWRADRPQKGRFREFYQCDADVVGSQSLWQEAEFIQLYDTVFTTLGLENTTIKINNRKILSGIAEVIGAQDKLIDFTVALDKLDKIGQEKVEEEMLSKGISEDAIQKVQPLFNFKGSNLENLEALEQLLATSEEGLQGVKELRFVINATTELGLQSANLELDVTLARGLNYYTGAIFEVAAPKGVKMGSIGGGGRYDDLTGIFGMKDVSGVGISFGLDRIYLVLEELGLFKSVDLPKPKVLFINFGDAEGLYCMKAISELRKHNIKSELYPDAAKMKKQMTYANNREIEFVVLAGSNEVAQEVFTLKSMISGEQQKCSLPELVKALS